MSICHLEGVKDEGEIYRILYLRTKYCTRLGDNQEYSECSCAFGRNASPLHLACEAGNLARLKEWFDVKGFNYEDVAMFRTNTGKDWRQSLASPLYSWIEHWHTMERSMFMEGLSYLLAHDAFVIDKRNDEDVFDIANARGCYPVVDAYLTRIYQPPGKHLHDIGRIPNLDTLDVYMKHGMFKGKLVLEACKMWVGISPHYQTSLRGQCSLAWLPEIIGNPKYKVITWSLLPFLILPIGYRLDPDYVDPFRNRHHTYKLCGPEDRAWMLALKLLAHGAPVVNKLQDKHSLLGLEFCHNIQNLVSLCAMADKHHVPSDVMRLVRVMLLPSQIN